MLQKCLNTCTVSAKNQKYIQEISKISQILFLHLNIKKPFNGACTMQKYCSKRFHLNELTPQDFIDRLKS